MPTFAVSSWPTRVAPETVGGDVLAGGLMATRSVSAVIATADPSGFVAVTIAWMR